MKNNNFNLQILHHSEVFATREEAMVYLTDYYKPFSLEGEPVMVKYGDSRNPNLILAVGTSDASPGGFYAIDMATLENRVADIETTISDSDDALEDMNEILTGIINASGLNVDYNKINDKVSYQPDTRDSVIGEATTLAEAIDLLSKYSQRGISSNQVGVEDTNSIDLTLSGNSEEGKILTADVKISEAGNDDDLSFNNNIIGIKNDGIYAAAHLEYDDARHQLIFTTSGMKNNRYQNDAIVERIDLGMHTSVVADNTNKNVEITAVENDNIVTLSAEAKISNSSDNILENVDNKLFVDGRASKIKFQNTTVADKLIELSAADQALENSIEEALHNANVAGLTTDTSVITVERRSDGGANIKNDVRLGSGNSIIVSNGGLEANINVSVNEAQNKLILSVGNVNKEVTLPGVSIIDNITYDKTNKNIIITWKDGTQQTTIPVDDMLKTWIVVNDPSQPIVLDIDNSDIQMDKLSARLELRAGDNILGVENGKLFASETAINNKVNAEKTRAEAAEAQLRTDLTNAVNAEKTRAEAAEAQIGSNLTSSVETEKDRAEAAEAQLRADLTDAINAEKTRAEGVEGQLRTDVDKKIEQIEVEKHDNLTYFINVDGVKVGTITIPSDNYETLDEISYENGKLIFKLTNDGAEKILEADVASLIDTYTAGNGLVLNDKQFSVDLNNETEPYLTLTNEGIGIFGINAKFDEKADKTEIEALSNTIDTINGNASTEGSFAKADADVLNQAKAYTDSSVETVNAAIAEKQAQIDTLQSTVDTINGNASTEGSFAKADADVLNQAKEYTDSSVETVSNAVETLKDTVDTINGNVATEGSFAYADAAILNQSKAYTDENVQTVNTAIAEKQAQIDALQNSFGTFNYSDSAQAKKFVTSVSETDGVISVQKGSVSTDGSVLLSDTQDGGVELAVNIDGETIKKSNSNTLYVDKSEFAEYIGENAIVVGGETNHQKTITLNIKQSDNVLNQDENGLYSTLQLVSVTPSATEIKEEYQLQGINGVSLGQSIKIYKESHIVEIYLGEEIDTVNPQTGAITKNPGPKNSLNYVYVNVLGEYSMECVDVSKIYSENKYQDGFELDGEVVKVKVDGSSEQVNTAYDENGVATTTENVLSVSMDGIKVNNIQTAIDAKVNTLDATVGSTTVENNKHIAVQVVETDGKLTSLTVTEDLSDFALNTEVVQYVAGNGVNITDVNQTQRSISAVAVNNDPIIEVTENGIATKEDAIWDCGSYD